MSMHNNIGHQFMQARFKADLEGMLEYFEKYPLKREIIENESLRIYFDSNFNRFESFGGREAMTRILLTAFRKQKDCLEDFDTPRFTEGLKASEFLRLLEIYNLQPYVVHELCALDGKYALLALQSIFQETDPRLQSNKSYLYFTYVKLMLNLDESDTKFYDESESAFVKQVSDHVEDPVQFTSIIGLFRDISMCFSRSGIQHSIKRFRALSCVDKIYASYSREIPETAIHIMAFPFGSKCEKIQSSKRKRSSTLCLRHKTDQTDRKSEKSLKETWTLSAIKYNTMTKHEQAFVTICDGLEKRVFPGSSNMNQTLSEEDLAAFERLKTVIVNDDSTDEYLKRKKLWCVNVLMNRYMCFWVSVLEVVIQFIDLWASEIIYSNSEDVFASLVANENLVNMLYKSLSQLTNEHKKTGDGLDTIKKAVRLFEQSIESVTIPRHLNSIRQDLIGQIQNVRSCVFEIEGIWSFDYDVEMTFAMNQLTATDDTSLSKQDISKRLVLLSIIWPYKIVHRLVTYCVNNRDRYKVIVPLMKNMGNLCTLVATKAHGISYTLPLLVFEDITCSEGNIKESMFREITLTLKSIIVEDNEGDGPVILKPKSYSLQMEHFISTGIIKNLILQSSEKETEATIKSPINFKLGLYILDLFCKFPLEKETDWKDYLKSLPTESYMSINCCEVSMRFKSLLEDTPEWIGLEEKEKILKYTENLAVYINEFGLRYDWNPECEPRRLLDTLVDNSNYQTILLWLDYLHIFEKSKAVTSLTKKLNTYMHSNGVDKEQWNELFKVFMLSKQMASEIFKINDPLCKESMEVLHKHPYSCDIVKQGFRQALHPKHGFGLAPLFPKLLVHFLGLLFESFPAQEIIIQCMYRDVGVKYLIKRLAPSEMKKLFTVLYTVELIKEQSKKDHFYNDANDRYYTAGLLKVLKNFNSWETICHVDNPSSLNRLSKYLNDHENIVELNIIPPITEAEQPTKEEVNQPTKKYAHDIKNVYYPLLDEDGISKRSLSLLTIILLCSIKLDNVFLQVMISSLIHHIAEGLIDNENQNRFEKMFASQTKARISQWKKVGKPKKTVMLRPILAKDEKLLMADAIKKLYNEDQILEIFDLANTKSLPRMSRSLYLF